MPMLLDGVPYGFFDGASQHHPPHLGVGALLHIFDDLFFKIRYAPQRGLNKKVELSGLWALFVMFELLNLRKVQICGDSKVVVDWVSGKEKLQVGHLQPIMRQIREHLARFE